MRVLHTVAFLIFCGVSTVFATESVPEQIAELLSKMDSQATDSKLGSSLLSTDAKVDLQSSVVEMLSREKAKTEDAYKMLFLEKKQHEVLSSELMKESSQLKERGVFLEKLQGCLNEGPTEEKLKAKADELFKKESKLINAREELSAMRQEAAHRESTLVASEELSHRKNAAIEKALATAESANSLLETKEKDLNEQESLVRQSEADILSRLAALNEREKVLEGKQKRLAEQVERSRTEHASLGNTREDMRESSFLQVASSKCGSQDSCESCRECKSCAWCASSSDGKSGTCMPHSVLSASDGLTSGRCPTRNWYSKVADRFTVMNLNIHGSDASDQRHRAVGFFNTIVSANYPDFVGLQDVADWFLELLKQETWFKTYYHITQYANTNGLDAAPGGLAILSRFEIVRTSYAQRYEPSYHAIDQFPRVLMADFKVADTEFTVATTALDWRNPKSRVEGLNFVKGVTSGVENLIITGAFAFDEGHEPETSALPTDWVDTWLRVHNRSGSAVISPSGPKRRGPNLFGYTWDPVSNLYARLVDQTNPPARIDRVFTRSNVFLPREINLVGCGAPDFLCQDPPLPGAADNALPFKAVPGERKPDSVMLSSPHYGLLATYSLFVSHC